MEVGLKIKNYLDNKGITQAFLSRKTGIDIVKLNLALNGNRRLTFDEYCIVCWALNLDTNYFLHPRMPDRKEGEGAVDFKETREMSTLEVKNESERL